jgi:hypothetical protein
VNLQVPIPSVAPLPPHTPWWEIILAILAIGSVIVYASSLATSWWPSRKRSAKNRRFSRLWGWTLPAMLVLVLGLAFVDTRWQDHRKDLEDQRDALVRELSAPVIEELGKVNDLNITSGTLRSISEPSVDSDWVQATLTDGTEVYCDITIVNKDGQRFAQLDPKSCR